MQVKLFSDKPTGYWTIANQSKFIFATVWNKILQHADRDDNYLLIWHNKTARKFSFTTYLAYTQVLPTIDRLTNWGMNIDLQCVLCNKFDETHQHLFIECEFSTYLWKALLLKLDLQPDTVDTLNQLLSTLKRIFTSKSAVQHLAYVAASTRAYHI